MQEDFNIEKVEFQNYAADLRDERNAAKQEQEMLQITSNALTNKINNLEIELFKNSQHIK
jgi:DNA-binding NtrC family response regulator